MYQIELLGAAQASNHLDEFIDLLRDAAESGASIGFLPPLDAADARESGPASFRATP